jgi:hypothetical protein
MVEEGTARAAPVTTKRGRDNPTRRAIGQRANERKQREEGTRRG